MNPVRPDDADTIRAVTLRRQADVAAARAAAARAMTAAGASVLKRTRFVTAVSEIARNAVIHGGGGTIRFTVTDGQDRLVTAECRDCGPGIADVARALSDGYSTARGLGLGLGGARRLVDVFEITSTPGGGVVVRLASRVR